MKKATVTIFGMYFIVVCIVNSLLNNDNMKTTHSALLLAWGGRLCITYYATNNPS